MRNFTAAVLALAMTACAVAPSTDSKCVLGSTNASQVMSQSTFEDPVDSLITAAVDSGHGWQCARATIGGRS
jgi:hypothetical protein